MLELVPFLGPYGPLVVALVVGWGGNAWFNSRIQKKVEDGIKKSFESDDFEDRVRKIVSDAFTRQLEPILTSIGELRRRVEKLEQQIEALKARGKTQRKGDLD
jgi:uncharacterized small protein (DUF1192 family)